MTIKTLLGTTSLIAVLALASPSFAQGNNASDVKQAPSASSTDMNQPAPSGQDQGAMNGGSGSNTQAAAPDMQSPKHPRRHIARSNASDGMDVAPGGGVYSRADVRTEDPDRMSHPVVGEAKAPSNAAQGDLAQVEQTEREQTANLNAQQLDGMPPQSASAPSNE